MPFLYPTTSLELKGKILIVPIVSTANVAQLAVDLLVSSLSLRRVAIIDPGYCIPACGGREDGIPGISTPLEVYGNNDSGLLLLQQRSPIIKSKKQEFVDAFLDCFKASGLASILFLSGVDLSNRTDAQMMTPTYRIIPANSPSLSSSPLHSLSELPIPSYSSPVPQHVTNSGAESEIAFIPGGGLTRRFLSALPQNWPIPTASILQFVLEGDNREDAYLLASVVVKVVNVECASWKEPASWKGVFGTPHDQTLYG
ncbi:PAC2 family-domain-containing protein [Mycena floridula]|nr:PAC2 family-domain-containing protein [Mycena floridula]